VLHNKNIFFDILKLIIFLAIPNLGAQAFSFHELSKNIQKHLLNNNAYVKSEVESDKGKQHLAFLASGLHHRSCKEAMKIIGRYEDYQNHIDFITKSTYKNDRINLELSSNFLPFNMILNFKLPRITDSGTYPFIFDNGFLLGLKGKIYVQEFKENKRYLCLIAMDANWSGKKTKIPDYIFEMFTKTIGEIGIGKLFRISGHRF